MDEFLNIKWEDDKLTFLEKQANQLEEPFLTEDAIENSYVFSNFKNPLSLTSAQGTPLSEEELRKRQTPYIPGREFNKNEKHPKSSLTKRQQAECLNAIMLINSGRYNPQKLTEQEKHSITTYEKFRPKINEENVRFLEYARQMWHKKKKKPCVNKCALNSYGSFLMKEQSKRYCNYSRFFKKVDTISLVYTEEEAPIEMVHLQNVLELGVLPKFTTPDFRTPLFLKPQTLPGLSTENGLFHSQLEVTKDENVKRILATNLIDVVISSSGLKRVIDNGDLNSPWCMPFFVEEVDVRVDHNVVRKKVIFFDKPLAKCRPNQGDLFDKCYKRLVKTNLCRFEALRYPNTDVEVINETKPDVAEQMKSAFLNTSNKTHHNVSYRVWKLKQNYDDVCELLKTKKKTPEFTLLVRCKLDACEPTESGALAPLVLVPKLQHQLEYGGQIQTKSELTREWTSLFFRPYSNSYRVHIGSKKSEVVLIEKSNMNRVNVEAFSNYNFKPHLGLGVLYKIIEKAVGLKPGEYLLRHLPQQGPFVGVYESTNESEPNTFDLHAEASTYSFNGKSLPPWCPIDVNLVLPSHKAYKRMPGMFPPTTATPSPKKGKKTKTKKRKKKKTSTL